MYRPSVRFSVFVVRQTNSFRCFSSKKLLEFLATMPKSNTARISEAQKQRQNIAKKGRKYTPSTVYLQLLGSGARGAPSTLYLFSDQKRYLFNCGESTQRLAHEHKVRLTRLDHIFITNKSWQNIGGLPGLSLTLQDVGVPNITLHGPEGLDELYFATRRFVIMKDMNVTMASCTPDHDFEDDVMTVKYVLLPRYDILDNIKHSPKRQKTRHIDKEFEEFVHDNTDYYGKATPKNKEKFAFGSINKSPTHKDASPPKTGKRSMEDYTVSYICTLKKRLGTLDLEKCVAKGVPPGPLLGQLKNGQDVILKGGTIVHSKDVKTPDDPGPVFIVLEVPDIAYLKEEQFAAHYQSPGNQPDNIPTVVVHFTPQHVMNLERYQKFMRNFGQNTRHLIVNSQNTCLGSEAVHRTQHRLHLLDTDIFPLLKDVSLKAVWDTTPPVNLKTESPEKSRCLEELKNKIAIAQFQNIISMEGRRESGDKDAFAGLDVVNGKTLMIHHLRPKREIDRSAEPKLHIQEYLKEAMDIDGFGATLSNFQKIADGIRDTKTSSPSDYPRVVFLGTGSCIPSKTRNTSAIALQIDDNRSLLMDCGEGTFGQLVRFYGPKRVNAFLRSLKAVYISHLHADHHIGLIGIIQARREAFQDPEASGVPFEPLYLLAPGQIYSWLNTYDQEFEKIKRDFTLIPNQGLLKNVPKSDMTSAILASIGVERIVTCQVSHCPNAFGVAIHVNQDKKITYSGDTLPCEELVKIGEDSTLLIHEATMEDELKDEARTKMHSTTSQAIDIGRKMNARFTVLTHFSQRYARLPRLNAQILNDNTSVGIAFDNMQITLNDLPLLPYMYAPLQMMFADHCVEMELRAAQRNTKKERLESLSRKNSRKLSFLPSTLRRCNDKSTAKSKPNESVNGTSGRFHKVVVVAQNEVICQTPKESNADDVIMRKRCSFQDSKKLPTNSFYKETNSSILRQKLKGMPVFGAIRSSSVSPSRKNSTYKSEAPFIKKQKVRSSSIPVRKKPVTSTPSQPPKEHQKTTINKPKYEKNENLLTENNEKSKEHIQLTETESVINMLTTSLHNNEASKVTQENLDDDLNFLDQRMKMMQDKLQEQIKLKKKEQIEKAAFKNSKTELNTYNANSEAKHFSNGYWLNHVENQQINNEKISEDAFNTNARSKIKSGCHERTAGPKGNIEPKPANVNLSKNQDSFNKNNVILNRKDSTIDPHLSSSTATVTLSPSKTGKNKSLLRRPNGKTMTESQNAIKETCWPRDNGLELINVKKFEPSLEDIQSTEAMTHVKRKCKVNLKSCCDVSKPNPFNEEDRRNLLVEAKRKFQSKSFREDFRFERIEGLNWISWKQ